MYVDNIEEISMDVFWGVLGGYVEADKELRFGCEILSKQRDLGEVCMCRFSFFGLRMFFVYIILGCLQGDFNVKNRCVK